VADKPVLSEFDGNIEAYELEDFFARVRRVLDEQGVFTVADYQRELAAARNSAQEHSAGYGES
jgi:hypothetical protein